MSTTGGKPGINTPVQEREQQHAALFERTVHEIEKVQAVDNVNHPKHYTSHPSGVECIQVTEHLNFNLGSAVKYIWRHGLKENESADRLTDLRKAAWYINREIDRLTALGED